SCVRTGSFLSTTRAFTSRQTMRMPSVWSPAGVSCAGGNMRKTTWLAMFVVAVVSFGLGASLKNINSGHIEAVNAILTSRSGFSFGFPPDPCFEPIDGFPPDPCLAASVGPTSGLEQQVNVAAVPGGDTVMTISLPDPAFPPGPCRIVVDRAAASTGFEIVDTNGLPLVFAPQNLVCRPPG